MRRFLRSLTVAGLSIAALAAMPAVDSVAITVSDLDRSVDFYSRVLKFQKISEYEVTGEGYEHLEGVFGVRIRAARMQLGTESIERWSTWLRRVGLYRRIHGRMTAGSSTSRSL